MKLSIIILNFNTKDYLSQALQSIKASHDNLAKEIIVVDNASTDGSAAMVKNKFPWAKLIIAPKNNGYATGNNLGLKKAKGELVLLLNSDTKILPLTLEIMVKYMDDNPYVGVSTCKVELVDGSLDPACHRGFPTPWSSLTYFLGLEKAFPHSQIFSGYHQWWKNLNLPHEIDTPAGAFYLTRKKIINQIGLLDERYFMYAEDIDWSLRIKQAGWKIMYVPTTKIIHFKKKSGRDTNDPHLKRRTTSHFFQTMKLFYDKHYQDKYPAIIRWLTLAGIWVVSKLKK